MSIESPYRKYEEILLHGGYSTAEALSNFVLSCYNGSLASFRGDTLANFDAHHFNIFIELAEHYHKTREDDPELLRIGDALWKARRSWGNKLLEDLAAHRSIDPKQWEDGSEYDYHEHLRRLERTKNEFQAKGWIDAA